MLKNQNKDILVDAVITWVDGNDKAWQEKLNQYAEVKIDFESKEQSVRYNSIGEIQIAIKSIIKFAPFIKNIFLVTDNQVPEDFDRLKKLATTKDIKLTLIDHEIIFKGYEDSLPCFNSCSIGSMLFRIPNLAEHFIIFNDDTFLMRETTIDDFFLNEYPIVRGDWKIFYENQTFRKIYYKVLSFFGISKKNKAAGFKKFQQTSAKLAEMTKYVRRYHTPVSLRKSTVELFFRNNKLLKHNVQHRFRNENQFIISSLAEHLELKNNTAHYTKDTQLTYFRSYKRPSEVKKKLEKFSNDKRKLFMTFQSLEVADENTLNYILNWIDARIN